MNLRLSQRAAADLDGIATHIAARDPQAAEHVQAQLAEALRLLLEHPWAGRHIGGGLHRYVVPRLPYLIIYRVDARAGAVAVATVRHTARRPIA